MVYFDSFAGVLPSPPPKKSSGDFDFDFAAVFFLPPPPPKKSNCILTVGDACAGCRSRGVSAGIRALDVDELKSMSIARWLPEGW